MNYIFLKRIGLGETKGQGFVIGVVIVGWAISAAILNASAITFRIVG